VYGKIVSSTGEVVTGEGKTFAAIGNIVILYNLERAFTLFSKYVDEI
jgi:hypothetical protein